MFLVSFEYKHRGFYGTTTHDTNKELNALAKAVAAGPDPEVIWIRIWKKVGSGFRSKKRSDSL